MLSTWHPWHVCFGEASFRITLMCPRGESAVSDTVSPQKNPVYVPESASHLENMALIARFAPEVQT